jgi:hypothetical protein
MRFVITGLVLGLMFGAPALSHAESYACSVTLKFTGAVSKEVTEKEYTGDANGSSSDEAARAFQAAQLTACQAINGDCQVVRTASCK